MTAPDRMPEAFENSLHDAGHPHMEPPANPEQFISTMSLCSTSGICGICCLRYLLLSYVNYCNIIRTHLSLAKDAPARRPVHTVGRIQRRLILGGLHHQYIRI
jgi:hypothetical protein